MLLRHIKRNRGSALLLSILALAVITALAMGLCAAGNSTLHLSDQHRQSSAALFAAEGGMQVTATWLTSLEFSSSPGLATLASDIAEGLPAGEYFGGRTPTISNGTLVLPEVSLDRGTFQTFIQEVAGQTNRYLVTVVGQYDGWSKRVSMEMQLAGGGASPVWGKGILNRGPIEIWGGAFADGVNDRSESEVFSAWTGAGYSLVMKGGASLNGDVYLVADDIDSACSINGGALIDGEDKWGDALIWEHIHCGADDIEFPEPDVSVFEAVAPPPSEAVTQVKSFYDRNRGDWGEWVDTFNNVRIAAGSNPTISNDTKINGIIYIEAPNKVKIAGGCQITGIIVTEDGRGVDGECSIELQGGAALHPPEDLPDTPEFAALKELKGTAILAPGFDLTMRGGFGTIGGTIAVQSFDIAGGAGGTIKGSLLAWGDETCVMRGGAYFHFDQSEVPDEGPAGFVGGGKKVAEFDWSSYEIVIGSGS